jgi:hypothetical protein
MTEPPSGSQLPPLRASDVDRERVAELLRAAGADGRLDFDELEERLQTAYAAKTHQELEPLLADITLSPGTAPTRIDNAAPVVRDGPEGTHRITSIMSGHDRGGRWRVAPRLKVLNLMGASTLDFREAELSDEVTHVQITSILGGGDIRVPEGVEVQISQLSIMGGDDIELGDSVASPGSPQLHLRLVSIMGGVKVRRPERKQRREVGTAGELPAPPARDHEESPESGGDFHEG